MPKTKPTVYLLYGDHELAIAEAITSICQRLGDTATASMNVLRFDSQTLDITSLEAACGAVPFLAERRIVILEGARQVADSNRSERLFSLMEQLPQSTALILVDHGRPQHHKGRQSSLLRWAQENPSKAFVRHFPIPKGAAFVRWILDRCHSMGGAIEPKAAQLLSETVAFDPRLALQEISKLLAYVDLARPIRAEDVEHLSTLRGQSDIFAMVDALGQRNGSDAILHLQRLLETESDRRIFAMVIRQFRLLLRAREALDLDLDPKQALADEVKSDFVLGKIISQARNFTLTDLERLYHLLLEIDVGSKTGQVDLQVALQTLIAQLAA
ncbi:MAG: DNA polymerase III subunit delta [Anaerolineales bacterium]|jgi:DNA polymerase-3 subunit delta